MTNDDIELRHNRTEKKIAKGKKEEENRKNVRHFNK